MIFLSRPSISEEEIQEVARVLRSGWLGMGPYSLKFEEQCKIILNCNHFISLSTGTRALEVALIIAGCKQGDEVLIPSNTYHAAVQIIIKLSLIPVFVDSNESDLNISLSDMERKISNKTKFIMPVHFRGRSCEMEKIRDFANTNNLIIIEDAAHAFGSKYKNEYVGQNSTFACFSFGPIKNITCGSGGGIATNSEEIANQIVKYRNVGVSKSTWQRFDKTTKEINPWEINVDFIGDRCHMPDLNAAIGLMQLSKINEFKLNKKRIITLYEESFKDIKEIELLQTNMENDFLYIYPILVPSSMRTALMQYMLGNGIHTSIHYHPNHLQPIFRKFNKSSLPNIEKMGEMYFSIPAYNDLDATQQNHVIEIISNFFLDKNKNKSYYVQ